MVAVSAVGGAVGGAVGEAVSGAADGAVCNAVGGRVFTATAQKYSPCVRSINGMFRYQRLRLPVETLRTMWVLTLSANEWGGRLQPRVQDGVCVLSVQDTALIRGTSLEVHADAAHYSGNDPRTVVRVASTPFDAEVRGYMPMCDSPATINMIFHSHALHMGRSAVLAPPSMGDYFAHCILSNFCNATLHGQLNTTVVMAYEGLYVYTITPEAYGRYAARIRALMDGRAQTALERARYAKGELPHDVVELLKAEFFNAVRPSYEAFLREAAALTRRLDMGTAGAPTLNDMLWACYGCLPPVPLAFGFHRTMQLEPVRRFLADQNPYLRGLRAHGFDYSFYPAPFTGAVELLTPCRIV